VIRTLVKRVEIDHHQVNVVFKVDPFPPSSDPSKDCLQHCTGRGDATLLQFLLLQLVPLCAYELQQYPYQLTQVAMRVWE